MSDNVNTINNNVNVNVNETTSKNTVKVYTSKYYDHSEKKSKVIRPEGHSYSVAFDVEECWYGKVKISRIPAKDANAALAKAGKMLTQVLPGAYPVNACYHEDK